MTAASEASTTVPSNTGSLAANPEVGKETGVPEQKTKSETQSTSSSSDLEKNEISQEPAVERQSLESSKGEKKVETSALEEAKELDRPQDDDIVYPTGVKLAIITLALCVSVFLVALVCCPQWCPWTSLRY